MKRSAKGRRRRAANRARRKRARTWPVRVLVGDLLGLLKHIAPEKADFLKTELDRLGAKIQVDETDDPFHFFAAPSANLIRAGTGAMGRLWATGYGFFCIYSRVAAEKRQDLRRQELQFRDNPRTAKASRLLSWTVKTEMEIADAIAEKKPLKGPRLWPVGLPRPNQPAGYASDGHVAHELFLCAAAFILHHELAHLRLAHRRGSAAENRKLEAEADQAAAAWILSGIEPSDDRYRKRALGIALVLGWLASSGLFLVEDHVNHPPSYDRVVSVLEPFVPDQNDLIWAFVSTMLRANLDAARVSFDETREASSFRDDVDCCLSVFRRNQWRGKLSKSRTHRE
jgi:hypothetical protein